MNVHFGIPLQAPLGQGLAHAAGAYDFVDRPAGGHEEAAQPRHRAEGVMPVGREGIRPVGELDGFGLGQDRHAAITSSMTGMKRSHSGLSSCWLNSQCIFRRPFLGVGFEAADQKGARVFAAIKRLSGSRMTGVVG